MRKIIIKLIIIVNARECCSLCSINEGVAVARLDPYSRFPTTLTIVAKQNPFSASPEESYHQY